MASVKEIEYAIMELSEPEFIELKIRMDKFYWKKWGRKIESDIEDARSEWDLDEKHNIVRRKF